MSGALRGVDVCAVSLRRRRYAQAIPVLRLRRSGVSSHLHPTNTHSVLHRGVSMALRLRRVVCYYFRLCVFVRKYRGDVEPLRDRVVCNNKEIGRDSKLVL